MSLLSLIAALLLEQVHPLHSRKYLYTWLAGYVEYFQRSFNAGERSHGVIAWVLAVAGPLVLVVSVHCLLLDLHPAFAWAFSVLVLYLTMGFRKFSHYYTDIHNALRENDESEARRLLGEWLGKSCNELSREELARVTIEQALLCSHRNVFGVVFWFVIFMMLGLGPVGAILYRLALFINGRWGEQNEDGFAGFGEFARQAYHIVEWLPLRLTAATFAIVGNFEDTAYCWRNQAADWPDPEAGILLAGGAGALGAKLGQTIVLDGQPSFRPEIGTGDDADVDIMQSAIGLVWRALLFQLFMLLMLTVANLLG
ncbi:MAG: CobD/CbiB family protein [Gammaproteobacteria bacterium]|nr:CobD/CbiB family protein [Gammaproteobacteria bacterium]MBU1777160.1 CobD/CbiB family protein [Gammaproteobacteria bacterium]MBU1969136.1 CobD/CbiB family protein [Gammaproteobacteria bacterium]